MSDQQRRPVGRRPGGGDTRSDIVRAAREQFGRGFRDASVRSIAKQAGVDPSLVIQFFGSKDELFLAAMQDAMQPSVELQSLLDSDDQQMGAAIARWFLGLWEVPRTRDPIQAMVVSAVSHEPAAQLLRTFVTEQLISRVAARSPHHDRHLRAALAGSQLVGAALLRHVYRMPPLAEAPFEVVVARVGRAVQGHLFDSDH